MQLHNTANAPEHNTTATKPCAHSDGRPNHWCPADAFHCTFCPRVFRTAQALGGHMNIHRRQRATANENGTYFHNLRGDSQDPTSMLFRPSHLPVCQQSGSSQQQQQQVPTNNLSPAAQRNFVENCFANRTIATAPDAPRHATPNFTNFFAPVQAADMTNRADRTNRVADVSNHRVGRNRGGCGTNSTDPLSWLFAQLPPPDCSTALQLNQPALQLRQQLQQHPQQHQQHHQHQPYRATNVLFQNNQVAKPRHVVRPPAAYVEDTPAHERTRRLGGAAAGSCHGEQEGAQEGLDLELRL